MLTQLRKPRYLRLAALMLLVATICVAAGTWQIQRLIEKHDANVLLRSNAEGPVAPVHDVLARIPAPTATTSATTTTAPTATPTPTAAAAPAQGHHAQFRIVTATGVYVTGAQVLVREQTVDDTVGFLVLTPLRTVATAGSASADLLVVRGFLPAQGETSQMPTPAAPPTGKVTVRARVQPADTADDEFGRVPDQVRRINAAQMGGRLNTAVYAGYAELLATQPGTAGLTVIPDPDLSNAAGGAIEPQHVAYIIQWYLFALIALAAPLVMARADAQREGDAPVRFRAKPDPWAELADDDGALELTSTAGEQDPSSERLGPQAMVRRYGPTRRV